MIPTEVTTMWPATGNGVGTGVGVGKGVGVGVEAGVSVGAGTDVGDGVGVAVGTGNGVVVADPHPARTSTPPSASPRIAWPFMVRET